MEQRRLPVRIFLFEKSARQAGWLRALASFSALGCLCLVLSAAIAAFRVAPTTISFPYLDPDLHTEIPASSDMGISFRVTALEPGELWALEFGARSDLTSGTNTIPIANVRWTISGTAIPSGTFRAGELSLNVFQPAGQGPGETVAKKAEVAASVRFYLEHSRTYAPGTYTAIVDVRVSDAKSVKTTTVTLTITIPSRATLTLGMGAINFPPAHPDLVRVIDAGENPISVNVSVQMSATTVTTLTCLAGGDLVSGSDSIPIASVNWTATGSGFLSGSMSRISAQPVGQWTGAGSWIGALSFRLANSWDYTVGAYSAAVIYTLTSL